MAKNLFAFFKIKTFIKKTDFLFYLIFTSDTVNQNKVAKQKRSCVYFKI